MNYKISCLTGSQEVTSSSLVCSTSEQHNIIERYCACSQAGEARLQAFFIAIILIPIPP